MSELVVNDDKRDEDTNDEKPLAIIQKILRSRRCTTTTKLGPKKNFNCATCQKKFKIKSELVQHQYINHGFGIKCKICSRTFSNTTACLTHLATKHSGQGYPCWKCHFKTVKQSKFKNHVLKKHASYLAADKGQGSEKENGDFKVDVDKKETNESEKTGFSCNLCEATFTFKSRLLRHKNEEHGKNIECDVCTQVFSSIASLRSHMFTKHTGKDKICEICGYSTKKNYDFKRHQVKHNNAYTVVCLDCNKGFYSIYDFNEHKNVHTAERPYQCELCGVDYSRRSSLALHKNRKHPEIYDLSKKCAICNQVCLTKETMEAHLKTHVEGRKRYYCDICGKGLLTKAILKNHRRSHTGEKPYDCSYCNRAFSCKKNLSVHIRLHTGDRPYSCKVCWKGYTKSSALKAHVKTHAGRL